jgi:hypothetical protein
MRTCTEQLLDRLAEMAAIYVTCDAIEQDPAPQGLAEAPNILGSLPTGSDMTRWDVPPWDESTDAQAARRPNGRNC